MALDAVLQSFAKIDGPATQTLTFPFDPTALFFFGNSLIAEGFADQAYHLFRGLASVSVQRAVGATGYDNAGIVDPGYAGPSPAMYIKDIAPADALPKVIVIPFGYELESIASQARITAWAGNSVDLTWLTDSTAFFGPGHIIQHQFLTGTIIHVLALGGSDFSSYVQSFQVGGSYPGSQAITGVPFAPTGVITLHPNTASDATTIIGGEGEIGMGWMTPTGQGAALSNRQGGFVASSTTRRIQRSTYARLMSTAVVTNMFSADQFLSLDANGFSYTHPSTLGSGASAGVPYLAVGGSCVADAGALLQPATPGVQRIPTIVRNPKVLFLQSVGLAQDLSVVILGSNQADASMAFGVACGDQQRALWTGSQNGVLPTVEARYYSTTDVLTIATPAADGALSTLLARAGFAGFGDRYFDLDWTAVDATAREVLWCVLGEANPVLPGGCDSVLPMAAVTGRAGCAAGV